VGGPPRRGRDGSARRERRSGDPGGPRAPPLMRTLPVGDLAASVRPMLEARSVAVVGASARPGSFGETLMIQLLGGGFEGEVHPVNPRYDEILGHRCVGSLAELAEAAGLVDLAILGVS